MADPTAARAGPRMRGVYPVLVTPFDERGELDLAGLERCVAFCLEAGAHGVVALVNASEFTTLSDSERRRIADRVVGAVAGQVPVVMGVSAGTARLAAGYATDARTAGADAVIAMPPFVRAATRSQVRDYFRAIAVASGLPVFIQNYHGYPAAQLTVDAVIELVCSIDGVSYVKEEALPPGQRMSELIERAGSSLEGVMGGLAGRFMIDEFERGACGTMPACEITDVHVAIWRALEAVTWRARPSTPARAAADDGVAVRRRRLQGGPPAARNHRSR